MMALFKRHPKVKPPTAAEIARQRIRDLTKAIEEGHDPNARRQLRLISGLSIEREFTNSRSDGVEPSSGNK